MPQFILSWGQLGCTVLFILTSVKLVLLLALLVSFSFKTLYIGCSVIKTLALFVLFVCITYGECWVRPLGLANVLAVFHPTGVLACLGAFSLCRFNLNPSMPWVLGVSIILGGLWAQQEFNWGGWWSWDPIESPILLLLMLVVWYKHTIMTKQSLSAVSRLCRVLVYWVFVVYALNKLSWVGMPSLHRFTSLNISWVFVLLGYRSSVRAAAVVGVLLLSTIILVGSDVIGVLLLCGLFYLVYRILYYPKLICTSNWFSTKGGCVPTSHLLYIGLALLVVIFFVKKFSTCLSGLGFLGHTYLIALVGGLDHFQLNLRAGLVVGSGTSEIKCFLKPVITGVRWWFGLALQKKSV